MSISKLGAEEPKLAPNYRASQSPARRETYGPCTDWIVESNDGLLCACMCESEARMVAQACNSFASLSAQKEKLVEALKLLYDKWENGTQCYEDPENYTGPLGHAFKLNDDEETRVLEAFELAGVRTALTFARAADRALLAQSRGDVV